ncbi:MAG: hypothetical protein NTW96_24290 [Planctomycetia bacterium]|nr:hypothetical protein [Planctomycetia bacterium]
MGETELTFEFVPSGRNGTATVTATIGGDVLAVESFNLTKPKARAEFAESVCRDRAGIERDQVDAELLKIAAELARRPEPSEPVEAGDKGEPDYLATMPESVRAAARAMLESSDLLLRIRADIEALGVAGERELGMTIFLTGVSRLLPRPLATIVHGPTSSGKSYTVEKVATLFPPETVLHATQMTLQALFHMEPGSLVNRFVIGGERSRAENDDHAETTRALREMLSSGRLVKLMPEKGAGGVIVTRQIEQEGPIAYVETTTANTIFDEDANRCLLVHTDEREEQTRRILDALSGQYEGGRRSGAVQEIIDRHHAAQRMLQALDVVVPFAGKLAAALPAEKVELRRAYPLLIGCVQASALLHQFQRKVSSDTCGRVIATGDDYALARHLLAKPMAERLGERLSDAALPCVLFALHCGEG